MTRSWLYLLGISGLIAAVCAALALSTPSDGGGIEPRKRHSVEDVQQAVVEDVQQAVPDLGANANLQGLRLFPADNAWNTPIDHLPVDAHSDDYIASIGFDTHLHPDFGSGNVGIPYVVVGGDQPRWPVTFEWPDESDLGLYPVPPDPPVESGSDHHVIVVDRDHGRLYELYGVRREGARWLAGSGAIFDINSNALRPQGWTSADAAGLPILPGLVRYDEAAERREIRHALRFTARKTQRAYVHPARHYASKDTAENLPPMGLRVRLKASYDVSGFPPTAQVVLVALKKYGMILADNGGDWFITGAPDDRWNNEELVTLKRVTGADLEVVETGNIIR